VAIRFALRTLKTSPDPWCGTRRDALGSIDSIEKSIKTLFDLKTFTLHPANVAKYTAAGGAVIAVAGTLFNVLAAFTYNLISDAVGGIRFEVVSDAPAETA